MAFAHHYRPEMNTIVMGIKQMFPSGDDVAEWFVIMAINIGHDTSSYGYLNAETFVRGLMDSEK